ncbi:40S ribosomal protein SA [Sciurus carolinensis]|uniref:40S ribosomal protein SA n=1 Tax=Sciurus carolinensis TaxID=30640 RepID=A0AA41NEX4_SCICA|nr:40S ribosomal protein SA [Sciurus carolinensis]
MSGALDALQMKEEDVLKFLAAGTHLGGTNLDFQMEQYVYKRKSDGIYIINLKRTWEKLLLAARAIVAIENPANVSVISSRNTGQRAVLKFTAATGATPIAGCFTPGNFTNQIQATFVSHGFWWLLIPRLTTGLLRKHLMSICPPLLCVTHSPLCYVDIAIPCNNKGAHSVGLMWMLAEKFCACVAPFPLNTRGRSLLISTSTEILKRLKRQSCCCKSCNQGGISG